MLSVPIFFALYLIIFYEVNVVQSILRQLTLKDSFLRVFGVNMVWGFSYRSTATVMKVKFLTILLRLMIDNALSVLIINNQLGDMNNRLMVTMADQMHKLAQNSLW